jgi:protein-L-isoaspartate(D-aspartate) O-methyltransferase
MGAERAGSGRLALALLLGAATVASAMTLSKDLDPYAEPRARMVEQQIEARGVRHPGVLAAMAEVPRHLFVPPAYRDQAYEDHPLPLDAGQTISQPYVVAFMTEQLDLGPGDKVLEVGTGSGYHAAVLSRLSGRVYSIEILDSLARQARETLAGLGYDNVAVRSGDGYQGWPEEAPFDAIVLTAAPREVPEPLLDQLRIGGRMVVPVGGFHQDLLVLTKTPDGIETRNVLPVRFVPMTGEAQDRGR